MFFLRNLQLENSPSINRKEFEYGNSHFEEKENHSAFLEYDHTTLDAANKFRMNYLNSANFQAKGQINNLDRAFMSDSFSSTLDETFLYTPSTNSIPNYSNQYSIEQPMERNYEITDMNASQFLKSKQTPLEVLKRGLNTGNHSFFSNQIEENDEWKKNFLHLSEEYQRKFAILIMIMQVCEQGLHEIIYRMNNYSGNESARIADQVANFVRGLKSSFCVEKQRIEEARIVAINRIMDPQITNIEKKSKLIATTAACYRISILYDKALLKLVENALLQLEASNITYEYVLMIFKPCATKEQSTTKRQYLENLRFQFQQQSLTKFCKFSNPITETLLQAAQIYGMYPSVEVKRQLADTCGLTLAQVTSWFSNRRNRMKNKTKNS